jgi:hypothetical protein
MHTKDGRALQTSGTTLYTGSGRVVGRVRDSRLFDQDGHYVGTVVGDRLVYRAAERNKVGPGFTAARCPAGRCMIVPGSPCCAARSRPCPSKAPSPDG